MKNMQILLTGLRCVFFLILFCGIPKAEEIPDVILAYEKADVKGVNAKKSEIDIDGVVSNYLNLKNALTMENSKDASAAAISLQNEVKNLDVSRLTTVQRKTYGKISKNAMEHTEHIRKNSDKIFHQREHFSMLSRDISELVNNFGTGQKLYLDFCPMFNRGKGAIWLSETKEINNPYYGKRMPSCGSVKNEL